MKKRGKPIVISLVVLLGLVLPQTGWGWGWKSAQTPDDVMNFLNSSGGYQTSVIDAKISASEIGGRTEFTVFYKSGDQAVKKGGWRWKRSTTPGDMMNFLNGSGAYQYPVKRALVTSHVNPPFSISQIRNPQ